MDDNLSNKNIKLSFAILRESGPKAAFLFMCEAIEQGDDSYCALDLAGMFALQSMLYKEAIDFYTQIIERCLLDNDMWYWGLSVICRAYCFMKIGYYDKAKEDLSILHDPEDPDFNVGWIRPPGPFSKKSILEEIALYEQG
jgi:tetratricopeptide (TPR) repeat protein